MPVNKEPIHLPRGVTEETPLALCFAEKLDPSIGMAAASVHLTGANQVLDYD